MNYYRCAQACGHVWTTSKDSGAIVSGRVTPLTKKTHPLK